MIVCLVLVKFIFGSLEECRCRIMSPRPGNDTLVLKASKNSEF